MTLGAPVRRALLAALVAAAVVPAVGCSSAGTSQSATAPTSMVTSTTASTDTSLSSDPGPDSPGRGLLAPVGFRSVVLTVTLPDGSTRQHCLWLADDEASQEQGLMGVTDPELGGRAGMVFSFSSDTRVAFWMKNTPLPLSIAWFNADGGFVSSADMQPCPAGTRTCPSYSAKGPYRIAIEVPLGGLESLGLVAGSRLVIGDECDQLSLAAPPAV